MMIDQDLAVGLVGYGEVGSTFARGWREHRPDLSISAYDVAWNPARQAQALELGVHISPTLRDLVSQNNLVICAVVPQAACNAASAAGPFLTPQHLYVDATSVGPAKTREIAELVGTTSGQFAKLALMGAVAAFGYTVPMVTSGTGAHSLVRALGGLGMNINALNDDPAAAATLKLCRSLFQKSIVSLALEALQVAKKNGVEKEVVASLAETWNAEGFDVALNRLICSSTTHARRRSAELDEALEAFSEMGVDLPVAQASRRGFASLVALQERDAFGGKQPKEFAQVLQALDDQAKA